MISLIKAKQTFHYIVLVVILISISSCLVNNKVNYISEIPESYDTTSIYYKSDYEPYRLKPFDVLYIRIHSMNKDVTAAFEFGQANNSSSAMGTQGGSFLSGYNVSDSGYIHVPILGKMKVEGMSIPELQSFLQAKTDEYLKSSIIVVKLLSFKLTFLGEVNSQGSQFVYQDRINMLEAMALCGGINDYGNKRKVRLIRKTPEGFKSFYLDLSDINLPSYKDFFLKSDDIMYVSPIAWKNFTRTVSNFSFVISTFVSAVTIVLLITKL